MSTPSDSHATEPPAAGTAGQPATGDPLADATVPPAGDAPVAAEVCEGISDPSCERGAPGAPLSEWTPQRVHRNAKQFVKFGLVGGSGVLVNLAVFNLTMRTWAFATGHEGGDLPLQAEYLANALGFVVSLLTNYALNRRWTFRSSGRKRRELPKFFIVSLTAYAVNAVVFHICRVQLELAPNPSQLIAIACVMPINFVFNKLWSFR